MFGRFDLLQGLLQPLNDFRMLVVEVIALSEILFQVLELHGRIARLGFRPWAASEEFRVPAIALSFKELPFSNADGEGARPAAMHYHGAFGIRQLLAKQSRQFLANDGSNGSHHIGQRCRFRRSGAKFDFTRPSRQEGNAMSPSVRSPLPPRNGPLGTWPLIRRDSSKSD